ncbi:sugar transferase [Candidatus Sumerlaeota bacterium]|nr:sugar transferase [Candidatus Sumerlaeota bacterium]
MIRKSFWKSRWLTFVLLIFDAIFYSFLWFGAYYLRRWANPFFANPINDLVNYIKAAPGFLTVWLFATAYHGHYSHKEKISSLNQVSGIFKAAMAGLLGILALAHFLYKNLELGRTVILFSSLFNFFYLYISRTYLRELKRRCITAGIGSIKCLIVGAGECGTKVMEHIIGHPEIGFDLIGFVDDDPLKKNVSQVPVLGNLKEIPQIIRQHNIEEVFLAIPSLPHNRQMDIIVESDGTGVDFKIVSDIFGVITSQVKIGEIDEIPVIKLKPGSLSPTQSLVKRIMDVIIAILLFIPALLIWPIIVLYIRMDSRGPAIFKQERIGKDGKSFLLYKFRTMYIDTPKFQEAPDHPDDPRITRIGRFLRKYSLDELPQLINVLKGDMSMVGPRPEMPFIVSQYEEWQYRRLSVKPGITGLWQIVGRKKLPLNQNLEYDFYYIKNQSILLDLIILWKTIPAVLFGKGAF